MSPDGEGKASGALYILDGEFRPQRCHSLEAWQLWMATMGALIPQREDELEDGAITVRTGFTGVDQGPGEGPPLVWGSIICDHRAGGHDHLRAEARATLDEARAAHAELLAFAQALVQGDMQQAA